MDYEEKSKLIQQKYDLKIKLEKLRHKNLMEELKLMGEAGIRSYQRQ